ncbi:unnamed protein product [Ixodes pacificus]
MCNALRQKQLCSLRRAFQSRQFTSVNVFHNSRFVEGNTTCKNRHSTHLVTSVNSSGVACSRLFSSV